MSVIAAALRELMAAGVTGDALIAAIERIEAAATSVAEKPDRSKAAERMARYREHRKASGLTPYFEGRQFMPALKARDGDGCVYCASATGNTVDHMVPVSRGGTDHLDNLALACAPCNSGKCNRELGDGASIKSQTARAAYVRYVREHVRCVGEHSGTPLVPPSLPPTPPNITPLNPPTTDETASAGPKAKRGRRLPDDWQPDDADRAFAAAHGLNPEEIDRGAFEFRNYWTSRAGREACKVNWSRTWQNRVVGIADRKRERSAKLAPRPAQRGGGGQGVADFASIAARRERERRDAHDVSSDGEALPGSFRVVSGGEGR